MTDEHGKRFDPARVFPYAFRHTYAQLRADAGVPLDILQVLMAHQDPSTTQVYYRPSHPRRVEAVRAIAAEYHDLLAPQLSGGKDSAVMMFVLMEAARAAGLADRVISYLSSLGVLE
ncbi:tyrosine-type recombinase/integrase [Streptomyces sp. NPDC007905]|uniref:tyrosine-type recombinase/integrase n=1 Tax=Streptomyces sp. NPDC007905 TaxID=3364788 RepID=UPI0036E50340